jgi:hypothetical protein
MIFQLYEPQEHTRMLLPHVSNANQLCELQRNVHVIGNVRYTHHVKSIHIYVILIN